MGQVFILAKNEKANIGKCLASVTKLGWKVTVLDSGSTDGTVETANNEMNVEVEGYCYRGHLQAYNEVTTLRARAGEVALILDADMTLSEALVKEVVAGAEEEAPWDVLVAPVVMMWCGRRLKHASLYPPKPIVFRGGREYFEASGHGERLKAGVRSRATAGWVIHDDRKEYVEYVAAQLRYAAALCVRVAAGKGTLRDRLRTRTPLLIVAAPLWSWLVRGGWRDGGAGTLYALDRMIAEVLMFREAIRRRLGT